MLFAQIADLFEDSTWRWILAICTGSPLIALLIRSLIGLVREQKLYDSKIAWVMGYYVSLLFLALPSLILASQLPILICLGYGLIGAGPIIAFFVLFGGAFSMRASAGHCKACGYFLGSGVEEKCPACGAEINATAPR